MSIQLSEKSPLLKDSFCFGTATAAFQIEGGIADRNPCNWDYFCEQKGKIADNSNGVVACDHIHRWREDFEILRAMGVDAYRFSISWPRVMDSAGNVCQKGVDLYLAMLDWLNDNDIKPFVTLYHWDLPLHLDQRGGWLDRQTAYRFAEYVDAITRLFGDRVYSYATLNEPFCSAYLGYETGVHAPGISDVRAGRAAGHHLLLAHGLGMQVLRKNAPQAMNGIVLNISPTYPASNAEQDVLAAELADQQLNQWLFQPILDGSYPEALNLLPEGSYPPVQDGDLDIISQPLDFLGINYYFREIYESDQCGGYQPIAVKPPPTTDMGWEIYPAGLTDTLMDLQQKYQLPPLFITENGAAMPDVVTNGVVNDTTRAQYIQDHLLALEQAVLQGVDVRGYFAWSLLDNFEWAEGYSKRFGLVHVDYETQQRIVKYSGDAFKQLLLSRPHQQHRL